MASFWSRIRNALTGWDRRRHLLVLLLLFVPVFFGFSLGKMEPTAHPAGDAPQYLNGAYNLLQHNVYSSQSAPSPSMVPEPDAFRPPAYAFFLSLGMRVLPPLWDADASWFHDNKAHALDPAYIWLKYLQVLLLLATALAGAWMVYDITKSPAYAHWCLWLLAFNPVLQRYVERFYSEMFGIFLVTMFAASLYKAMRDRSFPYFCLAGLLFGGVTLTFAQWEYVLPFVALSLPVAALFTRRDRGRILAGFVLLLLGVGLVVGPWHYRNSQLLHRHSLSDRGGKVLLLRAHYNRMDPATYGASFLYWSYGLPKQLLKAFADEQTYQFLDREYPEGARISALQEYGELSETFRDDPAALDGHLRSLAIQRILEHPVRHLLVSIPIGFRNIQDPTFSVFMVLVYGMYAYGMVAALRQRRFDMVCALLAVIPLVSFNALVTHGLPRYSWQITPLVWSGALCGLHAWRRRRSG
ncbi:hypothetical protein SAMN02745704_01571 [Paucidesulfovibrio gracilis DSM 16080]|uniref:Dolichyl-phosphate-mannose-protein mannosyltransferase n=1 Tax=Paucidesulfovibrio gracilis DSM 16080 TaxID=1121449 RepID=A0A1T4X0Z3_9BACT|nr:hypothetical protein [Paucidesulfovibrio gracilis]SKA82531.1 hypothetical protein SAMN02745704_01571 [Paucidesulfovibrio gracilis DSM 16080]